CRAISKEMGLLGQVSPRQLKKKWDYLKEKYMVSLLLKNPPAGMENMSRPSSWRWFHLMDQALSGKLAGTGKILRPSQMDEDEELNVSLQPLSPSNTEEDASGLEILETGNPTLPLHSDGDNMAPTSSFFSPRNMDHETNDLEQKLSELQRERMVLDREQTEFDKELIALEKDRELLNRDMVTVQRERTALDRDRAAVERDRALVERDRAFLERDRAVLEKDRRTRFRKEREAVLETRQRLLSLFQKLVEKL
uniref:Uncharacterized protein n=1 Tax=Cynoglossus semilaevis TaxID=244447 RepID=A0A3P8X7E4_CYNSE